MPGRAAARGDPEVRAPFRAWPRRGRETGAAGGRGDKGPSTSPPGRLRSELASGPLEPCFGLRGRSAQDPRPESTWGPRTDLGKPLPQPESMQRATVRPGDRRTDEKMPDRADGTQTVRTCRGKTVRGRAACVAGARWQMSLAEGSLSAPHVPAHRRLPGWSSGPLRRKDPSSCRTSPTPRLSPTLGLREGPSPLLLPGFAARGTTGWRRRRAWSRGECQGPSRWERGYIQAVGSLSSPTYLFIFPKVPGRGWPQGLGGKGGRRRERERGEAHSHRDRSGELALSGRAGARLHCTPPALRVGDPAEAGVAMQRKARVAGRVGEQQGPSGSSVCWTRGRGQLGRALSRPRC